MMIMMMVFLENSANMHLAGDLPGIWDFTFKKEKTVLVSFQYVACSSRSVPT